MKNKSPRVALSTPIIASFISGIILIVGGYYAFQAPVFENQLGTSSGNQEKNTVSTEVMNNWETYKNDRYGVAFQHPKEWYAYEAESSNDLPVEPYLHLAFLPVDSEPDWNTAQELPKNTIISVYFGYTNKSFENIYEETVFGREHNPDIKVSKTDINGIPTVRTTDGLAIMRLDNQVILSFSASYDEYDNLEKMLKTVGMTAN